MCLEKLKTEKLRWKNTPIPKKSSQLTWISILAKVSDSFYNHIKSVQWIWQHGWLLQDKETEKQSSNPSGKPKTGKPK